MSDNQQYGKWAVVSHEDPNNRMSGDVYFVQNTETTDEEIYVIKTDNGSGDFLHEIEAAASMDHPNVINVVDYSLDEEEPWMVAEYYKGGTLSESNYVDWPVRERYICYKYLCGAYAYMQEQGYSRFDSNFHNTVLKEDGRTPVLIDFERATEIESSKGIIQIYSGLGKLFWRLMTGKDFDLKMHEERRLNEEIESLTSELEELKQKKAELLN